MSVITPALPFEAPPPAEALVPTWPHIMATVSAEGSCQLAIDGTVHQVDAHAEGGLKAAIEGRVIEHAQRLGRAVRMDIVNPSGTGQLIVTPAGEVTDAQPDAPRTHPRPPAPPVEQDVPALGAHGGLAEQWALPLPTPGPEWASAPDYYEVAPAAAMPPREPDEAAVTQPRRAPAPAPVPDALPKPAEHVGAAPTLADLLSGRTTTRRAPAQQGWRAGLRSITGGAISPRPGRTELARLDAAAAIARPLDGPKTVVVVNTKGGAPKTTVALLLAATFGMHRGYTLAWDNNESLGTLGWRAKEVPHTRTAIDLLADLSLLDSPGTRVGDLDAYVRAQTWGHFDVLASNEDAATNAVIDGPAFERMHATLARFYRVMVVDTGNNPLAPNWTAALAAADELVFSVREDTGQNAAWLADRLHATGNGDLVTNAVTVMTASARSTDPEQGQRLREHFSRLTRTVISVPHDPSLISGGPIDYPALSPASRDAWLHVTAAVSDGL